MTSLKTWMLRLAPNPAGPPADDPDGNWADFGKSMDALKRLLNGTAPAAAQQ